jgi:hypothetical protein
MATTANYFNDDFKSYLESNDAGDEQANDTLNLYPNLGDVAGINPSALNYEAYPNLSVLGKSFSLSPITIPAHSVDSSLHRTSIYDHALDAVFQANSNAQSNAQFRTTRAILTSPPYGGDNNVQSVASESTATPTFERDSPHHTVRRRSMNGVKSRQKRSTQPAPSKHSRQKSKAMVSSPDIEKFDDDEGEYSGEDLSKSKRERALERNRIAASKCREKKKAHHQELEERARHLGDERKALINNVRALQDQLFAIKSHFLEHVDCQCTDIRDYIKSTVRPITTNGIAMYQAFDEYVVNQMNGTATPAMGVAQLQSSLNHMANDGLPSDVVAAIGGIGFRPDHHQLQDGDCS